MSQAGSSNTTLALFSAMRDPTPYNHALSDADERAERQAQCFATTHLTIALAGLRLCQTQAATGYASEMLDGHIAQLTDMLSDLGGWEDRIGEAVANPKH